MMYCRVRLWTVGRVDFQKEKVHVSLVCQNVEIPVLFDMVNDVQCCWRVCAGTKRCTGSSGLLVRCYELECVRTRSWIENFLLCVVSGLRVCWGLLQWSVLTYLSTRSVNLLSHTDKLAYTLKNTD
jgi:hypothetical protein